MTLFFANLQDMYVVHNSVHNLMPQRYPAEPTFQSLLQGSYGYDIGLRYSQESNSPMWSQVCPCSLLNLLLLKILDFELLKIIFEVVFVCSLFFQLNSVFVHFRLWTSTKTSKLKMKMACKVK